LRRHQSTHPPMMKYLTHALGKGFSVRSWAGKGLAPILAATALLSLAPNLQAQTPVLVLSNKWSLAAGSRWDLDTGNLTRGVAINKLTGNVVLASRVTSNHVSVISGVDGSDLGTLNSSGISGGTLGLDLVGVADDG